ncbi:MAG TPA: hypothetical protein PK417_09495 [Hyphomonas sp.]|nr:hypothetical protein [Hyphomonas sp.]HRX72716.1 hypothetical protein [Hyphomonas sp.]
MPEGPDGKWRWIDIFWNSKDSAPDMRRLTNRLTRVFIAFMLLALSDIIGHFYWASQTGNPSDFARGGTLLVGLSILAFGYKKHLLDHERWRYQHKIEREGRGPESFLERHFLEESVRFFDGVNIAAAALGTLMAGYGDLWFSALLRTG